MFSRVGQLLRVGDGVTIYAVEDLVQMVVAALAVKDVLELVGTELYVFENRLIGRESPKNAVVAKVDNSVEMLFQSGNKLIRVVIDL